MDSIDDEQEAREEQTALQDHELKVMDLVDRLGRLVAVPQNSRPMTALDFLHKYLEKAEKSYRTTEQKESIEDLKLELRKNSQDLLSAEDGDELESRVDILERLLRVLKADVKHLAEMKEENLHYRQAEHWVHQGCSFLGSKCLPSTVIS